MQEITREEFMCLQKDVTEIKEALLGGKYNKGMGVVDRLSSVERFTIRQSKTNNIVKGVLVTLSFLITIGLGIITFFKK